MSKLDEAFLKAYAKVRETGQKPTVEAAAVPYHESSEDVWDETGTDSLLRADDGVVNVASFIARTASGRTRGTAQRPFGGVSEAETPKQPLAPDFGVEPTYEVERTQIVDGDHVLQGPHFQPISLDLAALDVFAAAATMVAETRGMGRSHVIHASAQQPSTVVREAIDSTVSMVSPKSPASSRAKPLDGLPDAATPPRDVRSRRPGTRQASAEALADIAGVNDGAEPVYVEPVRVRTFNSPATVAPSTPDLRIHKAHHFDPAETTNVASVQADVDSDVEDDVEMLAKAAVSSEPTMAHVANVEPWPDDVRSEETIQGEQIFVRADDAHQPLAETTEATEESRDPADANVEFVAAWEVDRFEFEDIVWELSAETSPLWQAAEQLEIACREGLRVLAVTSPARGQGRSTLAITLARMLSATGLNVALLDGDIDRPTLADKMRLEIRLGWGDAVRTGLSVEEIAVQSVEDGFTVLPSATPDATKAQRPAAEATGAMINRLRSAFDLIVVDTANVNVVGGWIPGADDCQIDAALVIQDMRAEDPDAMQACLRRLQKIGIANIGLVENFANA